MKRHIFLSLIISITLVAATCLAAIEVLPEYTTRIELSSSDINRIHCGHGEIGDVLFSEEKGIDVKIHGRDAFIKFAVQQTSEEMQYKHVPAELYVVCGDDMYMMIAEPKKIPATTIKLSSSLKKRISESRDFFKGLVFEEKIRKIIKLAYTDTLPDYFKVDNVAEDIGIFKEVRLMLVKSVRVEGEGIVLKEYAFRNDTDHDLHLKEEDFLIKEVTEHASAVSLDPHMLKRGEKGRLFIVERIKDKGPLLLFSGK